MILAEEGCGRPPQCGGAREEAVKSFIFISSSRSLLIIDRLPIIWFLFPHLT